MNKLLDDIYNSVMSGSLSKVSDLNSKLLINSITEGLLAISSPSEIQLDTAKKILDICNALYNNSVSAELLEDGVYDLLIVWYEKFRGKYPVGSVPIHFDETYNENFNQEEKKRLFKVMKIPEESMYMDRMKITPMVDFNKKDYLKPLFSIRYRNEVHSRDVSHNNPELVGTLDKCKFVLNDQARKSGVFDDSNVKIFERDFIQNHLSKGIISPIERFYMIAELKYDGISVEAEVTDRVLEARSRGDTERDLASDLTPILYGYRFPRIYGRNMTKIGMKFEAIITYDNLNELSKRTGVQYKNCRSALTAIFGSINGRDYQDLITLVPLACTIKDFDDRVQEIEFLNRFYSSGVYLNYAVLYGDYREILFHVKKFTEEADAFRDYALFMYDGVVVSYLDPIKIVKLGRKNSVNKYSIAIKFPSNVKRTIFTGYTYTVGSKGTITPIIHFLPVEFNGNVYTIASGYSFKRFIDLNLRPGDEIDVSYVNEVMPYVTKPDTINNRNNYLPPVDFISKCPSCGEDIKISETRKYAYCDNPSCNQRGYSRVANFVKRIGINGVSIGLIENLKCNTIVKLLETASDINMLKNTLGEVAGQNFHNAVYAIKGKKVKEYELLASVGFSSISLLKWKNICTVIRLDDILSKDPESIDYISTVLCDHFGCGESTINTIVNEKWFLMQDILAVKNFVSVQPKDSIGYEDNEEYVLSACMSGFRLAKDDPITKELEKDYPFVCLTNNFTKSTTNVVLIPYSDYTSSKVDKANKYGIKVMTLAEFMDKLRKNEPVV